MGVHFNIPADKPQEHGIIVAPLNVKVWVLNCTSKNEKVSTLIHYSVTILFVYALNKNITKRFNLILENKKRNIKCKLSQSSICKNTRRMLTLIGTLYPGFMVSLYLSLANNGGYHVTR
jgi:hypothetical protein